MVQTKLPPDHVSNFNPDMPAVIPLAPLCLFWTRDVETQFDDPRLD